MHFCTAYVAIAGDKNQIVHRGRFNPVSWPEIEVLRAVHGDDSVTEVNPFVEVEQDPRAERERLVLIYGGEALNLCFPGRNPRMDMNAPEVEPAYGAEWKNPLTQLHEFVPNAPEPTTDPKSNGKLAKGKKPEEPF